jgi:hypothetical protein
MINYPAAPAATPKQVHSLTSLTKAEFEALLKIFTPVWEEPDHQRGRPEKLASCGDKRFLSRCYLKTYPLQEVLGFLFGIDQSQANRWIKVLSRILKETLERGGYLLARTASQLEEQLAHLPPPADVIIEGAERRRPRPKDQEKQQEQYRGKKKPLA